MYIHIDYVVKTQSLGVVAAPCVACAQVTPHSLHRSGRILRVWFIPMGSGTTLRVVATCHQCREQSQVAESEFCKRVPAAAFDGMPLTELIRETNPLAEETLRQRLAAKERVRTGELLPEDRIDLIVQLILWLDPQVQKRVTQMHLDWPAAGLLLLVPTLGLVGLLNPLTARSPLIAAPFLLAAGAAGVTGVYRVATDARRHIRRRFGRELVDALAPYMPIREEMELARKRARQMGAQSARHVPIRWLADQLWQPKAEPSSAA